LQRWPELVAPCGAEIACHGLPKLMAIFTHGQLEMLAPIVDEVSREFRCLVRELLQARDCW
jgi:hypothetical protein